MNRKQQTFINEVLRHGDKTLAYKTAYPTAKGNSVYVGITRLMKEPEVDEILNGNLRRMRAELEAEMREKLKEEIAGELELKVSLTRIIRGQHIVPKYVWTKDGKQELEQHVGFAQLIRAIVELAKMERLYESGKSGERRAEEKKRQEEEKAEQKRLEREEKNRQDAIWEKAMREKFNNEFKGYTYVDVKDHYKALGDFDEKEESYITRLAYARDRENGIKNPWERASEPGPAGSKDLQAVKNTTDSLTTTNVKNVNDENLTKLNKPEFVNANDKTSEADKPKENKYANISRPGNRSLGPAPQLGTPEAKMYAGRLRANNWLPVQEMWNSANQDVAMGRKGAEYEQKKMKHLAALINNKDPQVREVASTYGLELHPDWLHWARELKCGLRRA